MTPIATPAIRKAYDAYRNAPHGTRQHYRRAYEAAVREQLERELLDEPDLLGLDPRIARAA